MSNFSMSIEDVNNCDITSWFKILQDYTIKSQFIKIPEEILNYLRQDGPIFLPMVEDKFLSKSEIQTKNVKNKNSSQWDSNDSWASDSDDDQDGKRPNFKNFNEKLWNLKSLLTTSSVFLKLNWSSASDAYFAIKNSKNGKVESISEIYKLLKSSDRIIHDLDRPYVYTNEFSLTRKSQDSNSIFRHEDYYHPTIVLKEFLPQVISKSEYRCFVRNNKILAICQRDKNTFYPHIVNDLKINKKYMLIFLTEIISLLSRSEEFTSKNYILDLSGHVDKKIEDDLNLDSDSYSENDIFRKLQKFYIIVDVNPFHHGHSQGLFFDWEEELYNPNIRKFWESEEMIISGVNNSKIYDWTGFCGMFRVRTKPN